MKAQRSSSFFDIFKLNKQVNFVVFAILVGIILFNLIVTLQFLYIFNLPLPFPAHFLLSLMGGMVGWLVGAIYFRLRQYASQMRQNESRFRAVLQHMPVMLDAFDAEGNVLFWNEECERVTGYQADEIMGQPQLLDKLYPGEGERPLTSHDYRNHESTIRARDGSTKHILWANLSHEFPIPGWASWRLGVEITEQKRAEEALRAAERDYRALFENIPDGIYRSSIDGRQLRANPALVALNGYRSEKEMLTDVRDIAQEWYVDSSRRREFQERIEKDGYILNFESEIYRHKTRERIWISESAHVVRDENGNSLYYEGTIKDITAQKKAEETIRATAQIRLIADHLPVWIAYLDKQEYCRFINSYHETLWGVPANQAIDRPLQDIVGNQLYQAMQPYISRALAGEQVNFDTNFAPYGKQLHLNITFVPHRVQEETAGFFALLVDITEQREKTGALHHLQKMESLSMLAGGIANDFNNLLLVILGHASMAQALLGSNSAALPHLERVAEATERAAALTRQMLVYAGRSYVALEAVDLNGLVEERVGALTAVIPPHIHLHHHLHTPLPAVKIDPAQIAQVIAALVHNSVEAISDPKGEITIITGQEQVRPDDMAYWQYTAEPLPTAVYACLAVQDSGSGMDKETVAKIFDPFFTTKDVGDGLNLAAVLGIIRAHKGGLTVQSEPGRGTTFKLLFPLAATAKVAQAASPVLAAEPPQGSTILVIDDDDAVRHAIVGMLQPHNLKVLAAAGGQQGIALYRQHQAEIGLVILDIVMPEMDGEETLLHLRQLNPHLAVILSSGYDEKEAAKRLVDHVLTGFLQKPYRAPALLKMVQRFIS